MPIFLELLHVGTGPQSLSKTSSRAFQQCWVVRVATTCVKYLRNYNIIGQPCLCSFGTAASDAEFYLCHCRLYFKIVHIMLTVLQHL